MLSPIFSTTPLSGKRLKLKFLRVRLVHPENPDILSERFTGLQDFQN